MPSGVINGIKLLLTKRFDDLRTLKISWFGGEPLLAKDSVLEISSYISEAAKRRPSLHYSGNMTTNGYLLTSEMLSTLVTVGIRHFQITLDGEGSAHDEVRVGANGQTTFARIWQNLISYSQLSENFEIVLRVHYRRSNLDGVSRVLDMIRKEFGGDNRYRVFLKELVRLGGRNDNCIELNGQQEKLRVTKLAQTYGRELNIATDIPDVPQCCYAAALNSFVIRSSGRIAKCTVAFDSPTNDVGYISESGELLVDNTKLRRWAQCLQTLDVSQMSCPASAIA